MVTGKGLEWCSICNSYHYNTTECKPKYSVYHREYLGDDCAFVYADDFEEAAEKYAEMYNADDYPMTTYPEETIKVIVEKDGIRQSFQVSARMKAIYSAKMITDNDV